MLNGIRGILFDFDGTLAPNLDLPDMRTQVIALTQSEQVPSEVYADHYIVEIIEAAQQWLSSQDAQRASRYAQAAHQLITDIEMAAARNTEVFANTRPTLSRLQSSDIRSAIVTRNCSPAVVQSFPDWDAYVGGLFARDQVTQLKPHPGHFQEALAAMGCAPSQAAIVSDGAMDMATGRQVGVRCIGVLTGSADRARLLEAGAHHVIEDLAALT